MRKHELGLEQSMNGSNFISDYISGIHYGIKSIALNVLFIPHKKKAIRQAFNSKHNSERPNQEILLMITDGTEIALPCNENFIQVITRNCIES